MTTLLRFLFQYRSMHRRISNQRKQLSDLNKAADICSQIETENSALKREVAMWRSEHDPCPFSLENETLRAEVERLEKQIKRFLEPVSNEERRVANHWTGCWTKDEVEYLIAKRLEPKGENDGSSTP